MCLFAAINLKTNTTSSSHFFNFKSTEDYAHAWGFYLMLNFLSQNNTNVERFHVWLCENYFINGLGVF